MEKSILWMLLSVVLVGCGANDLLSYGSNDVYYSFSDNLHTLDINEDANLVNDEVETDISLLEIIMDDEEIIETELNSYQPHPFAIALREYFGHLLEDSGGFFTTALLVPDIDGNGTQGVVAIKQYVRNIETSTFFGRVFYLYKEELLYKDIWKHEGIPYDSIFRIFVTLNPNSVSTNPDNYLPPLPLRLGIHLGMSITLFTIENGELVYYFSIVSENDGKRYYVPGGPREISGPSINFKTNDELWSNWENRKEITEEEFMNIREKYNLNGRGDVFFQMPDHTNQILNMNIEQCFEIP